MTPPPCSRLTAELAVLARSRHTTPEDIARRTEDHRLACPVCTGWSIPPYTPRDPQTQETT